MAEWGRGRQPIAAWPAGIAATGRRLVHWPAAFGRSSEWMAAILRRWLLAELAPGRMLPWMAVAIGLGIALYFTPEREPALSAAAALAAVRATAAFIARHRPAAFPLLLATAAVATGFAVATLRTTVVVSGSRNDGAVLLPMAEGVREPERGPGKAAEAA